MQSKYFGRWADKLSHAVQTFCLTAEEINVNFNRILLSIQKDLYSKAVALIEITDIKCLLGVINYVIKVFIDFKKAFDTVDHKICLWENEILMVFADMQICFFFQIKPNK